MIDMDLVLLHWEREQGTEREIGYRFKGVGWRSECMYMYINVYTIFGKY